MSNEIKKKDHQCSQLPQLNIFDQKMVSRNLVARELEWLDRCDISPFWMGNKTPLFLARIMKQALISCSTNYPLLLDMSITTRAVIT